MDIDAKKLAKVLTYKDEYLRTPRDVIAFIMVYASDEWISSTEVGYHMKNARRTLSHLVRVGAILEQDGKYYRSVRSNEIFGLITAYMYL